MPDDPLLEPELLDGAPTLLPVEFVSDELLLPLPLELLELEFVSRDMLRDGLDRSCDWSCHRCPSRNYPRHRPCFCRTRPPPTPMPSREQSMNTSYFTLSLLVAEGSLVLPHHTVSLAVLMPLGLLEAEAR